MLPNRDSSKLKDTPFDVVIVGGGIFGCAIAWEAINRGLKVALVEKGDFGRETSAGCFKIVHGGLRYLQQLNFSRVIESYKEQQALRRIAPHLVSPLPFLVPCYGRGAKSKEFLTLGLSIYDYLSRNKNQDTPSQNFLPKHEVLTNQEILSHTPGLPQKNLRGGVVFYDAQMHSSERLTAQFAISASEKGAVVLNYVEAKNFIFAPSSTSSSSNDTYSAGNNQEQNKKIISRLIVLDKLTGKEIEIQGKLFINATGPWGENFFCKALEECSLEQSRGNEAILKNQLDSEESCESKKQSNKIFFSKGLQIVLPKIYHSNHALAVQSSFEDEVSYVKRGGRSYFIQPWREVSLVGTADILEQRDADNFTFEESEIEDFLEDVKTAYNSELISKNNILNTFGGLRPIHETVQAKLAASSDVSVYGTVECLRHDEIVDHANLLGLRNIKNLITLVGVKYTTCRRVAEKVVDLCGNKLGIKIKESTTRNVPLIAGEIQSYEEVRKDLVNQGILQKYLLEFGKDSSEQQEQILYSLYKNYGARTKEIFDLIATNNNLGGIIPINSFLSNHVSLKAEVIYAIRNEFATNLGDVIFRTIGIGTIAFPGEQNLKETAEIMAEELGWDQSRVEEEVQMVKSKFYNLKVL